MYRLHNFAWTLAALTWALRERAAQLVAYDGRTKAAAIEGAAFYLDGARSFGGPPWAAVVAAACIVAGAVGSVAYALAVWTVGS